MSVWVMCFRCGFINQVDVPIITKDTDATFRCENCKFIVSQFFDSEEKT